MLRLAVSMATLGFVLAAGASASSAAQPAPPQTKAVPRAATKPTTGAIVNINTASASEMTTLPGIGAKTAARIVEYRQKNGPFKKVEELMNVRGIGEKNFLKLKPRLAVGPAKADHELQK
jgi:competence protein ComEA